MAKSVATQCPICSGELVISRLSCVNCQSRIETEISFSSLMRLPEDLRDFVVIFLRCRGNIREMEKELGISYPTVCKRLDLVNEHLAGKPAPARSRRLNRNEILEQLEQGKITAKEAADLLKGR
jgi:hypothetical protein